jgi:hypothetical protein
VLNQLVDCVEERSVVQENEIGKGPDSQSDVTSAGA